MLPRRDEPITFLRFGIHRKKELLRDTRKAYDGIVIPANVLLYQHKSTPLVVFITQKPFFVDPMSYLFGQTYEHFKRRATRGPEFKPSFRRLMEGHGLAPDEFVFHTYERLLSTLHSSERNLSVFCQNALNFQHNMVWDGVLKAKELMSEEDQKSLREDAYRPSILIPPYFLCEPDDVASRLNLAIIEKVWSERSKWPDIFPMVFIRRNHLCTAYLQSVLRMARRHAFPGYCVWIEDFDERSAIQSEIEALIDLVRALSSNSRQVVLLYGGFFGLVLHHFGVTAVCHGLAYGEAKSLEAAVRQTSGPPPVRYYVKELHCFLTLENALAVLRSRPDLLCSCPVCRRVVRGNPENIIDYQDEESLAEMHFLYNRYQERQLVATNKPKDIVDLLNWTNELYEDLGDIRREYRAGYGYEERAILNPAYIRAWRDAIQAKT